MGTSLLKLLDNPAELGFPATLPIEVVLKTAPLSEIRETYGYSREDWAELKFNPVFIKALVDAQEMIGKEGVSFRLKAGMQADALLKTSWDIIHNTTDDVPASVKADLLKSTVRWAGLDASVGQKAQAQAVGNALQIIIDLGGK